jgi:micrococcal nuclease
MRIEVLGIRNWGLKIVALCCLLLLWSCQVTESPTGKSVRVTRVVSGQSLEVLPSQGQDPFTQKIRLLGIEAPAWEQQPWSLNAKAELEALIGAGKTVLLEFDRQPQVQLRDGSTLNLAYVWQDGVLLNEKLVEQGWALAVSRSPNTKYAQRLAEAQEKARLMGVGIWNPDQPLRQFPKSN